MRIESSYPAPVHGVSTMDAINRPEGVASEQINMRSDPKNRLTRRLSGEWLEQHGTISDTILKHANFVIDGAEWDIFINSTGVLLAYRNNIRITNVSDVDNAADYLAIGTDSAAIDIKEIDGKLLISNPAALVYATNIPRSPAPVEAAHVNFVKAPTYGDKVKVQVEKDGTVYWVQWEVPSSVYTNAIDFQTTGFAADVIASVFEGAVYTGGFEDWITDSGNIPVGTGVANLATGNLGSTLGFRNLSGSTPKVEVSLPDELGKVFNQVVNDIEGLPKFAMPNSFITVKPNPLEDAGTYYLQAIETPENQEGLAGANGLREVIWAEATPDSLLNKLNNMPVEVLLAETSVIIQEPDWADRSTGDDNTVPMPSFVDDYITSTDVIQNRLAFTSSSTVTMSRTDEPLNFFKKSAAGLLATDPVEVVPGKTDAGLVQYTVAHNRDLLVFPENGQFSLAGSTPITPETVAMPQTTNYITDLSVSPISVGNVVYFATDYGDSIGISEYSGLENTTQDEATELTKHVIGYLEGTPRILAGSAHLDMVAVVGDVDNVIYVYETNKNTDGSTSQRAWSKWVLPEDVVVKNIVFQKGGMKIIVFNGFDPAIQLWFISVSDTAFTKDSNVLLDEKLTTPNELDDGKTYTIPNNYPADDTSLSIIAGEGCYEPYTEILTDYTYSFITDTITFDEPVAPTGITSYIHIGRRYTSRYTPTKPFIRDENGEVVTTDPIRMKDLLVNVSGTEQISLEITSKYYDTEVLTFDSTVLDDFDFDVVNRYTGDAIFDVNHSVDDIDFSMFTNGFLNMNINGIAYTGQYFRTSQRI